MHTQIWLFKTMSDNDSSSESGAEDGGGGKKLFFSYKCLLNYLILPWLDTNFTRKEHAKRRNKKPQKINKKKSCV